MSVRVDDFTYLENAVDRFNDPEFDLLEVYFRVSRHGEKERWKAGDVRKFWSQWAREARDGKGPDLLNLYLHIPYCRQKCTFCHHYSHGRHTDADITAYVESLKAQMEYYAPLVQDIPVRNFSFGGGTPSLLTAGQLEDLLGKMNSLFEFLPEGERVTELNPASATEEKLDVLKAAGMNRISIGVQSLDTKVLEAVNREYQDEEKVKAVIRWVKERRFERGINVDLLAGLVADNPENFERTVRAIAAERPDNIFINALRPTDKYLNKHFNDSLSAFETYYKPFAEKAAPLIETAAKEAGYEAVHKASDREWIYVLPGSKQDYKDNVNVYYEHSTDNFSMLGIGSNAQSHVFGRCHYIQEIREGVFDPSEPLYQGQRFTVRDEMLKHIFTKLRYRAPISKGEFKNKFDRSLDEEFKESIENAKARGLIRAQNGSYRLTSFTGRDEFLTGLHFAGREAIARALGEDEKREPIPKDVKNLELNVGMACNNKCIFCISGEVENNMRMWMPREIAHRELLHFYTNGCRSVGFLGGEPSAYPHILDSVRYAKTLGYQRIAMCSNGMKYHEKEFTNSLLTAGVTRFTISIHSHLEEIEDDLTGVPGNFARKMKGLRYLKEMQKSGRLPDNVSLNPVLNTKTVPHMADYVEFFMNEGFDDIRFNYIWPQSRVIDDKSIIPQYKDSMKMILKVMLLNESKWKIHLTFGGLPPCMLRWGGKELSSQMTHYLSVKYLLELEDLPTQTSLQGKERFDWNTITGRKRNMLKVHKKACEECPYFHVCEGVWKTYTDMYGKSEIVPMKPHEALGGHREVPA
jgi:oxygen-independent coproporphyrinogen-3 oxidase